MALAVAELVASLHRAWRSPVLDVGDRLVDAAPPFVKEFAIRTFGTNDKVALLVGIGALLAVYAAVVSVVGLRHRLGAGVVGIGLFGAVGVWAAASRRASGPWHVVLPSVAGAVVGVLALVVIWLAVQRRPLAEPLPQARRDFLTTSGAGSVRSRSGRSASGCSAASSVGASRRRRRVLRSGCPVRWSVSPRFRRPCRSTWWA